ncbi:MAG: cytochrome B5 [Armatimonadetes bacterium]|nr:cytochrome B5 [Armatimonadota bacterium]
MKSFTGEELAKYDGTGDNPAYVAYNGKVYDVSAGQNWDGGSHYEHLAGMDLTEEMQDAPHDDDVMSEFPVVGEFTD